MNIQPLNRHLVISLEVHEDKKPSVLVPEEYKIASRYTLATILNISNDCKLDVASGDKIIIESGMVENISLGHKEICLILENYVLGVVRKND